MSGSIGRRDFNHGLGALAGAACLSPANALAGTKRAVPKTLAERVKMLEDRRAILEVRARYCWAAARADARGIAALFTEDGVFTGPARPERFHLKGRAAIEGMLAPSVGRRPGVAVPFLYNHVVAVDGDLAEGTCVIKPHIEQDGKPMIGVYLEKLRRTTEGWRWYNRDLYLYSPYWEAPV